MLTNTHTHTHTHPMPPPLHDKEFVPGSHYLASERKREGERETDRQTARDRQRGTKRDRQRDRESETKTERERDRGRERVGKGGRKRERECVCVCVCAFVCSIFSTVLYTNCISVQFTHKLIVCSFTSMRWVVLIVHVMGGGGCVQIVHRLGGGGGCVFAYITASMPVTDQALAKALSSSYTCILPVRKLAEYMCVTLHYLMLHEASYSTQLEIKCYRMSIHVCVSFDTVPM